MGRLSGDPSPKGKGKPLPGGQLRFQRIRLPAGCLPRTVTWGRGQKEHKQNVACFSGIRQLQEFPAVAERRRQGAEGQAPSATEAGTRESCWPQASEGLGVAPSGHSARLQEGQVPAGQEASFNRKQISAPYKGSSWPMGCTGKVKQVCPHPSSAQVLRGRCEGDPQRWQASGFVDPDHLASEGLQLIHSRHPARAGDCLPRGLGFLDCLLHC